MKEKTTQVLFHPYSNGPFSNQMHYIDHTKNPKVNKKEDKKKAHLNYSFQQVTSTEKSQALS